MALLNTEGKSLWLIHENQPYRKHWCRKYWIILTGWINEEFWQDKKHFYMWFYRIWTVSVNCFSTCSHAYHKPDEVGRCNWLLTGFMSLPHSWTLQGCTSCICFTLKAFPTVRKKESFYCEAATRCVQQHISRRQNWPKTDSVQETKKQFKLFETTK